jgi:hypothetical protein
MVQNNQKTVFFMLVFHFLFLLFGAIWAPPNVLEKVDKGPQVGGMYGPMSKVKNKPHT